MLSLSLAQICYDLAIDYFESSHIYKIRHDKLIGCSGKNDPLNVQDENMGFHISREKRQLMNNKITFYYPCQSTNYDICCQFDIKFR